MAILLPQGKQQYFSLAGVPLVGGKVFTYDAGTTNPRTTYTDAAGLVPNANPVILDARGEATIFWSGAYKVQLTDSVGAVIWTQDNVSSISGANSLLDNYSVDSGVANAYIVAAAAGINAYVAGMRVAVKITNTNTAASTLNYMGLGVRNITLDGHALSGGELQANGIYQFEYDGAAFNLLNNTNPIVDIRTPAEVTAGVTVVNFNFPELDPNRYGKNTSPGVTPMNAAFNAAIAVAVAKGGAAIPVPAADYGITPPLNVPTGVYLVGPLVGEALGTVIAGGARFIALATGAIVQMGVAAAAFNCGVQGIVFKGLGSGIAATGVSLATATWCVVRYCAFDNFADNAIKASAASGACTFDMNFAVNCLLNRSRAQVDGVLDIDGNDHRVIDGEYTASLAALTSVNKRCAAIVLRGANHFVRAPVGEISDVGIYATCALSRIIGARGDLNFAEGIICSGSNHWVGCDAINNSQSAAGTYSGWLLTVANNELVGCGSSGIGAGQHKYGFEDTVDSNTKNRYVGCVATNYATKSFLTQNFAGGAVQLTDGPPKGFTSLDATPSVDQYLNFFTQNAGATLITAFDDATNGQTIRVLCTDANTTLVNGATIKTNTGANKVLAANRVYTFLYYSGIAYEI
jgi:hypothetical protein